MRAKTWIGAAMTADVVGSRSIEGFASVWPQLLGKLSKRHIKRGWIAEPYRTTAWDEFQNVVTEITLLPRLILDLRRTLAPVAVRIGAGIGRIERADLGRPINQSAGGPAFESAREALNDLREHFDKYPRLTAIRTGDAAQDRLLGVIWDLNDTLLQRVTARQWATVRAVLSARSRRHAAKLLEVRESTVTRNLQRGYFWQTERAAAELEELLAKRVARQRAKT